VNVSPSGQVSFIPRSNWNGVDSVQLRARDPLGLAALHSISVVVRAVNDPPSILTIGGLTARDGLEFSAKQDATFTTNVVAYDPDLQMEGERLFYVTNDTLVRFLSPSSPVLSFTPDNADVGRRPVRVFVRDTDYEAAVNVTFDIQNVNDAPEASIDEPLSGGTVNNTTLVRFTAYGTTDPDLMWGDVLTYIWESNMSGTIGHGRDLNATLIPGNHRISLIVTDASGLVSVCTVDLRVEVVVPPVPPIIPPGPGPTPPAGNGEELVLRFAVVMMIVLVLASAWFFVTPGGHRPRARPPVGPSRRGRRTVQKRTPERKSPEKVSDEATRRPIKKRRLKKEKGPGN
jgi:hypothetical protein